MATASLCFKAITSCSYKLKFEILYFVLLGRRKLFKKVSQKRIVGRECKSIDEVDCDTRLVPTTKLTRAAASWFVPINGLASAFG